MKTASIIAIFLINVFMSKRWPRVGHPALGGGPDRRHPRVGGEHPRLEEGMLITAGLTDNGAYHKSVKAYNPHINKICKLPDLPFHRWGHTLCGGLLCGGEDRSRTKNSCLKLGPAGFVKAKVSLKQSRTFHLCWNVPEGVLLLGGIYSPSTTELVLRDGSATVSKFNLSHPAR